MSTLSVRFPQDLEHKLAEEARLAHKRRSDLVREAVEEYIQRRERQRFMQEMVTEMHEWLGDAAAREESRQLADDTADDGMDAIIEAERAAGIDPGKRWWK